MEICHLLRSFKATPDLALTISKGFLYASVVVLPHRNEKQSE